MGALLWVALAAPRAAGQNGEGSGPSSASCPAFEIEYALAGRASVTDTAGGHADGTYDIGPGLAVLRFDNVDGAPGGWAQMVSYAMPVGFAVSTKTLFWTTTAVTDTESRSTPGVCDVAVGTLDGNQLRWTTPVNGFRVDGTITCAGPLCGSFGAPRRGVSDIHIPPRQVQFAPFTFGPGLETFTMPAAFVSRTTQPKMTAYVALSGREVSRRCVPTPVCK